MGMVFVSLVSRLLRYPPHPALRATFSPRGRRRGRCSLLVPLPLGERVDRPEAETGEGVLS